MVTKKNTTATSRMSYVIELSQGKINSQEIAVRKILKDKVLNSREIHNLMGEFKPLDISSTRRAITNLQNKEQLK